MNDLRLESEMVKSISAVPGNWKALRKPPGAKLPQCEVTRFINLLKFPWQKSVSWVFGSRFLPKRMHMSSLVHWLPDPWKVTGFTDSSADWYWGKSAFIDRILGNSKILKHTKLLFSESHWRRRRMSKHAWQPKHIWKDAYHCEILQKFKIIRKPLNCPTSSFNRLIISSVGKIVELVRHACLHIYKLNYIWKLLIDLKYKLYNFPQHTIEISLDSNSILEKKTCSSVWKNMKFSK